MRTTTKQYNLEFCVALGFMVTGRFTAVEVREVLFAHFKREALFRHLLCGESFQNSLSIEKDTCVTD